MAQRKRATRSRKQADTQAEKPVQLSEKDQKAFDALKDDMTEEQRGEWMKRRAAEERHAAEAAVETDRWYEKKGSKLILKIKKKSGGCLSFYRGNFKKHPELLKDPEVAKLLKE